MVNNISEAKILSELEADISQAQYERAGCKARLLAKLDDLQNNSEGLVHTPRARKLYDLANELFQCAGD